MYCNSNLKKNGPAKEKYHLREKPKNDEFFWGGGCHYRLLTHQSNSTWSLLGVYFVSTWCILDVKAPCDWIRWLPNVQTRSTSLTWCLLRVYFVSTSCLLGACRSSWLLSKNSGPVTVTVGHWWAK